VTIKCEPRKQGKQLLVIVYKYCIQHYCRQIHHYPYSIFTWTVLVTSLSDFWLIIAVASQRLCYSDLTLVMDTLSFPPGYSSTSLQKHGFDGGHTILFHW
jgi:hypothetical protein